MDGSDLKSVRTQRSISLVIPAWNEEAGILQAITEADMALSKIATNYEILVVDDGSGDGTAAIVTTAGSVFSSLRLLRHPRNRGYSAALRTGFEAAQFDRVAFTDADCQFHLEDLALLVGLTEKHEIAVGYRIDRKDSPRRRFFSWGYNTLVRGLMGTRVRDLDCALKVFRGEALLNLLPESSGFFINTEMLTRSRQLGYAVAEAGVRHRPRAAGVSKVSLLDIPRTLRTLLPYWWSNVAFPGQVAQPDASRVIVPKWSRNVQFLGFVLLVAMAGLLFFSRLNVPLQEPEETRYAEIPRQMLESNSWLTPVYHGMSYYDKPPLLYWAVMGAYRLFGVHDWSARFVSSLAAFLCVLVTYLWGRKVAGASAGLLAGFILCLSARFVYLGRLLTMNSLLCLFVIAGLAAGHIALTSPRHRRGW